MICSWVCLFWGFRGIGRPVFTAPYGYPRNVSADAKLETNFVHFPSALRASEDGKRVRWLVFGMPESHREAERRDPIVGDGRAARNEPAGDPRLDVGPRSGRHAGDADWP